MHSAVRLDLDRQNTLRRTLETSGNDFLGCGAFKTAQRTKLTMSQWDPTISSLVPQVGKRVDVASKRFFLESARGRRRWLPGDEFPRVYAEGNILYWAHVLLSMVYDYVHHIQTKKGDPPFSMPQVRFVNAAVGLTLRRAVNSKAQFPYSTCLIIEELLHMPDGGFTKFISNGDAVPLVKMGEDGFEVAEFLSFSQHVQYIKTGKLVYISDYQGVPK